MRQYDGPFRRLSQPFRLSNSCPFRLLFDPDLHPLDQHADLRLRDLTIASSPRRPLQEVMDEIGKNAAAKGLMPVVLESLLNDA